MFKGILSAMVIAGALIMPGQVRAEEPTAAYMSGAEIYEKCISGDPMDDLYCTAYVASVVDAAIMIDMDGLRLCVPPRTPVKALVRQVRSFLSGRPDAAGITGSAAIFFSLHGLYGCV